MNFSVYSLCNFRIRWKALLLCWLLLLVQPSFQGLVGRRRTTPSFEITEITSTCIQFKWGDPPYEAALKHFILQGTAVNSNKTVEMRFAATEREGFLCNLDPNTYYATSLISVTGDAGSTVKVDLQKVSTRSEDSNSSGPKVVHDASVNNLAKELTTDSNARMNNSNSTEKPETKTENSTPQSQEGLNQTSPARPSESDEQEIVQEEAVWQTAIAILGLAVASILAYHGTSYISSFSVVDVGEPSLNRMSSEALRPDSSHNDSIRRLTKSEYIETKMVERQTQLSLGYDAASTTTVNDLLFSDGCAVNTTTEGDMQRNLDLFAAGCANSELTISMDKTVIMHQPSPNADYCPPHINVKTTDIFLLNIPTKGGSQASETEPE
nr:unnamed protein product [Spirometra erinaceieuropaei]